MVEVASKCKHSAAMPPRVTLSRMQARLPHPLLQRVSLPLERRLGLIVLQLEVDEGAGNLQALLLGVH